MRNISMYSTEVRPSVGENGDRSCNESSCDIEWFLAMVRRIAMGQDHFPDRGTKAKLA
jgi:hypothetical protein